jgi:hypothetical protein
VWGFRDSGFVVDDAGRVTLRGARCWISSTRTPITRTRPARHWIDDQRPRYEPAVLDRREAGAALAATDYLEAQRARELVVSRPPDDRPR